VVSTELAPCEWAVKGSPTPDDFARAEALGVVGQEFGTEMGESLSESADPADETPGTARANEAAGSCPPFGE